MLRVVGRTFVIVALAALVVPSIALATPRYSPNPLIDDIGPVGASLRAPYSEPFTTYRLGEVSDQAGSSATKWSGHDGTGAQPPTNGGVNPTGFTNQGAFGNGGNSVFFDSNLVAGGSNPGACGAGTSPRVRTPANMDETLSTSGADLYLNDQGGGTYQFVPQSQTAGSVFTRVLFNYNGYIYILDRDATDTIIFAPVQVTTAVYGQWTTVQVVNTGDGHFNVMYGPDKQHLTQIYRSTGGSTGTALPFAPTVQQIVLLNDLCQLYGLPADGVNPVGTYWDNIEVKGPAIPEPGTLAMLGAGALLAIRRRSR